MTLCLTPQAPIEAFSRSGGKASQLARRAHDGLPVPPWVTLTADAMDLFLADSGLDPSPPPRADTAALEQFATEVTEQFLAAPLPEALSQQLHESLDKLDLTDALVAVRSSGLDEDSVDHSFAGQYETLLFRKGAEDIEDAIKRCWASAFSARVVGYRQMNGLPSAGARMGVVVQRMVNADRSGVAFSRNPVHPLDRDNLVISSVYGLGEGLVSGLLDADNFVVNRETLQVAERTIVTKDKALRQNPDGGVQPEDIPAEQQKASSLTDKQIEAVANLCMSCERADDRPQDIEWAFEGDELFLLQSRPITSLPPAGLFDGRVSGKAPTLWDNSNIIESYAGVTTPLTFSFASAAYRQVYLQFCEVMGVPQELLDAHEVTYRNMLGLIRGRIYYNLANWYRLLLLLPGASSSGDFMETMMGVKQGLTPEVQQLFEFMNHPPAYSVWQKAKLTAVMGTRFARIDSIVRTFQAHFKGVYEEARHRPMETMNLVDLAAFYQELSDKVLRNWQAPIINDYYTMVFFGLLKKLTEKWVGEDTKQSTLHNDLLCGEGDLESTEPTKMLMRMARLVDEGPADRRSWLIDADPTDAWRDMQRDNKFPELHALFEEFLDKYGFRCVNELKLEEPDLHDDPAFAVQAVAAYVRMKTYDIEAMDERERQIRSSAEKTVNGKLSFWQRAAFFWVVQRARKGVRHRENLRFARTKIFGIARHLFRAMGDRLVQLGELDNEHDIFYLTVEELQSYVEGRPNTLGLRQLVQARRREFDAYKRGMAPPDRFVTYGAAGPAMRYAQVLADADLLGDLNVSDDPSVLKGIACSPGEIEGEVRVVHSMEDAAGLNGEILVTERTDPGWVPLYPSCAGLLIERGSLLSHSAVVARELGLPAVVGISGGLMRKLKTGDRVRMNGATGEVKIL